MLGSFKLVISFGENAFYSLFIIGFQYEYQVMFCRCKSEACTLVELGLWPATPSKSVMAFTFGWMELMEKMFLVGKVSVQQCCASLPGFSNFPVSVLWHCDIEI